MEYRQLGGTDLKVSAITFGAWAIGGWMWGGAERKDALEAIHASYDQGVTSIDTAPIYGQGRSEEIVGEALRSMPRDKVQMVGARNRKQAIQNAHAIQIQLSKKEIREINSELKKLELAGEEVAA